MTVQMIDAFNRTGSNLGSNPTGRWSVQKTYGTTADFQLDGQSARTSSTWTHTTGAMALFIGVNPGVNQGTVTGRLKRDTTDVIKIGIVWRGNRTTPTTHSRLFFGYETASSGLVLRFYTASTVSSLLLPAVAQSLDTNWHTYSITTTGTVPAIGFPLMSINCKFDGVTVFQTLNIVDQFTNNSTTAWRAMGFEFDATSTFLTYPTASPPIPDWDANPTALTYQNVAPFANLPTPDVGRCDYLQFDDDITPVVDEEPELDATPSLTPVSVTLEADSGTSDELPVTPDFGEELTIAFNVAQFATNADYVVTFTRDLNGRKTYRVGYQTMSEANYDLLLQFFTDYADVPFKYTDSEGIQCFVMFASNSLSFTRSADGVYTDINFLLVEIKS